MYQGEDVFWAEVSTIRKINHMNLVRMWGFCSEGNHRLLVYEHMENQSLDKYLFSKVDVYSYGVVILELVKGIPLKLGYRRRRRA
ncbi:hypothetical protein NC652_016149 [Populus alba x Populus x berolinensis]|nr:hypothetical protein NC652_016149 [Populus alba x Populus x berolinensis]